MIYENDQIFDIVTKFSFVANFGIRVTYQLEND